MRDILNRYKDIRGAGKSLSSKILKVVPKRVFMQVAYEFKFVKKGVLVYDEGDTDVMSDRLFFDKQWENKGAVEHYIAEKGETSLTEAEHKFYQVMKGNRFSLFLIKDIVEGNYVVLEDRFDAASSDIRLLDINLSQTVKPGLLIATRILDFKDFHITSGIAYPFLYEEEILEYLKRKDPLRAKSRKKYQEDYAVYFYKMYKAFGETVEFRDI